MHEVYKLKTKVGSPSIGEGWAPIVMELVESLEEFGFDRETDISQIKEKFGTLRFYYDSSNIREEEQEYSYQLVDYAEMLSGRTCETCGEPGTTSPNQRGWLLTLCRECRRKEDA